MSAIRLEMHLPKKGKVANGLLLHSNQGCQYTSEEYFALTQEYHFVAFHVQTGLPL